MSLCTECRAPVPVDACWQLKGMSGALLKRPRPMVWSFCSPECLRTWSVIRAYEEELAGTARPE